MSSNQLIAFSNRVYRTIFHPLYLLDSNKNNHIYRFHVCGTYQDIYTVEISRLNGKVTCTCPDYIFYCTQQGIICKHLCFVLFKVLKILSYSNRRLFNEYYFAQDTIDFITNDLALTSSQLAICDTNFNNINYSDSTIVKDDLHSVFEAVKKNGKDMNKINDKYQLKDFMITKEPDKDQECLICYSVMKTDDDDELLSCPTCLNVIHRKCMEEWIHRNNYGSKNNHCIYCRGSWAKFVDVINNRQSQKNTVFRNLDSLRLDHICNQDMIDNDPTIYTNHPNEQAMIETTTISPDVTPQYQTNNNEEQTEEQTEEDFHHETSNEIDERSHPIIMGYLTKKITDLVYYFSKITNK